MSDQPTKLLSNKTSETRLTATPLPERLETLEHANTGRAMRVGLWALGIGLGGFLLWASLAPLDEGVPSPAMVSIDTKRKPVQHQTGGIVKEVLVTEGSLVTAGQPLIRLNDGMAQANYGAIRQQFLGLQAMQGRLQAERDGRNVIEFQADLLNAANSDPMIAQHIQNQQQLFLTRRAGLAADLQSIEEGIQGLEGTLKAYKVMQESRHDQLRLLSEEYAQTVELVKDGYVPRNKQLELERQIADVKVGIADLQGNMIRSQRSIMELRQKSIGRRSEFRKEVETNLADVTRQVQSDSGKFVAASDELERTVIRAPAAGQVVGLAFQTVGSVIAPGFKIMDIVPGDEQLVLEARVSPQMIDRVHVGQTVEIRFSAFAHSPILMVKGILKSVSRDLLVDEQSRTTYYLARVTVTPEGVKELGKRQLQPGMSAEVIFVTGERSMLTYLISPLTKRVAAAMKEE